MHPVRGKGCCSDHHWLRARRAGVLALAAAGILAGCGPTGGTNGRFCDVANRLAATADALDEPSIYTDPARLRDGLVQQVQAYGALADTAPKSIAADAGAVRDAFVKLDAAFKAVNYDSSGADSNPTAKAILIDPKFQQQRIALAQVTSNSCKLTISSAPLSAPTTSTTAASTTTVAPTTTAPTGG